MLRTVTLSLLMLISVVVMLPIASSTARSLRQAYASQPQQRRVRRHSRAWWRRYRARLKQRRAARAAALAHRKSELGLPLLATTTVDKVSAAAIPQLPAGWSNPTVGNNGEIKFQASKSAPAPSQATLAVVANSRPNPAYLTHREQQRLLAGVAFSDLRRIVIDKMINAGGWVINDYERQVNGSRVFVVIAQTPSDGRTPEKSWNFYFAEVGGKIYSLTLNTPVQFSNSLAAEGEKFMASIRAKTASKEQGANR